ncbi:hypothetical protein DLAC_00860 [Tieghemostelium lacteum]|uniref:F-box domain-containing protein n=1 Tax=Tieghemostelium lacteum TaxID=361077 RepID=A0A152A755_TIELA|nr:hypothetical protein DLAC_00860 [Tieghemostelium lacteum]|eukprot:KYR02060.1 hypothetical protein DLAC_00860 [Tieghemostelium lacteum]
MSTTFTILPLNVITEIVYKLLEFDYLPFKYKLSLGLICKFIFKRLDSHNTFKRFCCILKEAISQNSDYQNHLENKSCLLNSYKHLQIRISPDQTKVSHEQELYKLQKLGENITSMKVISHKPLNLLYTDFIRCFPNLVELQIDSYYDLLLDGLDLEDNPFPNLKKLNLTVHRFNDYIHLLLKKVKNNLTSITLLCINNNFTDEFRQTISTYYAPNLTSISIPVFIPFLDVLFDNHQYQLKTVVFSTKYSFHNNILQRLNNVESLSLYCEGQEGLNILRDICNLKNLKTLKLVNTHTNKNFGSWGRLWNIEELELSNWNPEFISEMIKVNSHSHTLKSLKINCKLYKDYKQLGEFILSCKNLYNLYIQYEVDDMDDSSLSMVLPKMKSLVKLYLSIFVMDGTHAHICDFLHLSESLQFIEIVVDYSELIKSVTQITCDPQKPFELIKTSKYRNSRHLFYIRNGIQKEDTSWQKEDTSWYSKFKNLINHYIKY